MCVAVWGPVLVLRVSPMIRYIWKPTVCYIKPSETAKGNAASIIWSWMTRCAHKMKTKILSGKHSTAKGQQGFFLAVPFVHSFTRRLSVPCLGQDFAKRPTYLGLTGSGPIDNGAGQRLLPARDHSPAVRPESVPFLRGPSCTLFLSLIHISRSRWTLPEAITFPIKPNFLSAA